MSRPTAAAVFALTLALLAGCSSTHRLASDTPRITASSVAHQQNAQLLTTADLHSVPGMPSDVAAVSVNSVDLYEDPDPRGACGAKVAQLDVSHGHNIGIQGGGIQGFESVVQLPIAQATAYLSALTADAKPGCPGYDSKTNTGELQHAELQQLVDVGALGDQRISAVLKITDQGQTAYGAAITVRVADRVLELVVFGDSPPPPETVVPLASRAVDRLVNGH